MGILDLIKRLKNIAEGLLATKLNQSGCLTITCYRYIWILFGGSGLRTGQRSDRCQIDHFRVKKRKYNKSNIQDRPPRKIHMIGILFVAAVIFSETKLMSLTLSSTTVNRSDAYLALGNSILLNDLNNGQCPNPCIAGGATWIPRRCQHLYNGGSKSTYICKIMQTRPNSDNKNNARDDKEAEENFGEVGTYL